MITLKNVVKNYNDEVQIGPIDVEMPSGGIIALIGPNGAGKSTMLTMMGRLMDVDEGEIIVGGMNVHTEKSSEIAKRLAILRQENHFVTRLTVRQLVGFGRYPHSHGRLTREDEHHIDQALEFLNLTALQDRYLDQLSGGQRQRVYVAMVIAQDTEYIFLDEPLNNLDMNHSVQMMQQLRRMVDELGRTVIVVLHDINFAGHYADHIVAMKNGNVEVFGKTQDVMKTDVLTDIFNTPVRLIEDAQSTVPIAVYF